MSSQARSVVSFTHLVTAPPEAVFPLLCPIREREWIPGWEGEVVYAESGVAERDGVFRAGLSGARFLYFVTRYEPPRAVEYLVVGDPAVADALALALEREDGGGTRLTWRRTFTALSADGAALVQQKAAGFEARVPRLAELLDGHFSRR